MKIIHTERNINLLPKPNEYHLVLDDILPPQELITAALGLIFEGDRFLMTQLTQRGWDIPGGHIEPSESPEQAVRREVVEETNATIRDLHLLGYARFNILAPKPDGYPYPHPVSYQVFYRGKVDQLKPFTPTLEAQSRRLFAPTEARQTGWVQRSPALYEAALHLTYPTNLINNNPLGYTL